MLRPEDFIITRKRKKYKFAVFANSPLCFEVEQWPQDTPQPTMLEIGAGTAAFSVGVAHAFPELQIVACDVKGDRLVTGARAAEADGLANVRFLRVRADKLGDVFAPGSVHTLWLTFPDPYPKKRAAKHRMTHSRFLEVYKSLLSPDGALYFKTDNHALFDWSLESLVACGWQIDQLTYDLHEADVPKHYKIITAYEQRYLNEEAKICFVRARPPRES